MRGGRRTRGIGPRGARRGPRAWLRRRGTFVRWFVVGAAITVPAVFVALLVPAGELLMPVLTPGVTLLGALDLPTATWHGAVTMLLAVVANGLVVGAAAVVVARAVRLVRR